MNIDGVQRSYAIVKEDTRNGMNFVRYPYELEVFDSNHDRRLSEIKTALEGGQYIPSSCDIADVPKGKGAVRPGSILTLPDQIAYTLLVDSIYDKLHAELLPLQGISDFAYQLQTDLHSDVWFRHQFKCWNEFKDKSLDKLGEGCQFVVITDVTGCYENIDLNLLVAELRRVGTPTDTLSLLRKLLKKWSQVGTKGLPQGVSASHLLAKLYMSGVDLEMKNLGYTQLRFVDDIRIFCNSIPEAKKALIDLTAILRRRGLNLQSAKSKFLQVNEAINEILGKATIIDSLHTKLRNEVTDTIEIDEYPYAIEVQINTGIPNPEQLDIIKQAFRDYLLSGDADFDKTLFHYLLNKLGNASDDIAVSFCINLLEKQPQETPYVLKYLSKLESAVIPYDALLEFLHSENALYDYQNYLIIQWLNEQAYHSDELESLIRYIAFDNNKPSYYRAAAKQSLARLNIHTDLLRIRDNINDIATDREKCAAICSLVGMEVSQRNSFLNETASSTPTLEDACAYTRAL